MRWSYRWVECRAPDTKLTFYVLLLLLVPWFIGCYNDSEVAESSSFERSLQVDQLTPISCVRLCAFNEK